MKKILVPFNFTEVSRNALQYAVNLFPEDAEFTVFHAIDGNLSVDEPLILSMGLTKEEGLKKEIQDIVQNIFESHSNLTFRIGMGVGNVVNAIMKLVRQDDYDAIVMGTRDKYDLLDQVFGTVSLGVIKRVSLPVYLIPPHVEFKPYKKVVVASDWHLESDEILNGIEEWNGKYKAELHFLHVEDKGDDDQGFIANIVEEFFEEREVPFSFVVDVKINKNVAKSILDYTTKEGADLQLVITDRATWLDTITSKSITKAMVLKSKHPMLFIHSGMMKKSRIFYDFLILQL